MFAPYKFELRKIKNSRKIVWITGCVMLVGLLIWGVASAVLPQSREYSDSSLNGYEANRAEREAAELISGRAIDQTLIDEMRPAYENFVFNGNYREALPYLDVYNLIGRTLGTQASAEILECDSEAFYERLNAQLEANTPAGLSESISFDEPIVYHGYFDGWQQIYGYDEVYCLYGNHVYRNLPFPGVYCGAHPQNRSGHSMYSVGQEKTVCRKNPCGLDGWYRLYAASLSVDVWYSRFPVWI